MIQYLLNKLSKIPDTIIFKTNYQKSMRYFSIQNMKNQDDSIFFKTNYTNRYNTIILKLICQNLITLRYDKCETKCYEAKRYDKTKLL